MPSNHLILCHPLLLLPSIFPNIRVFSSESAFCIRWSKYWNFSFSISPFNEYSGLIYFRINWFDLLAVQGTLKSSLAPQFRSINSSSINSLMLQASRSIKAFLMVQLLHLYKTTGKTKAFLSYTPLTVKRCLCFLICRQGLS